MEQLKGKLVVVTDAASEVGVAISENLVDAGIQVLGLGTRLGTLENVSVKLQNRPGTFQYFIMDLSSEQDIINAINWATENIGPVNVLINNAFLDMNTNLIDGLTAHWKKILNINVIGLNVVTREVVKNMIDNKINGHVIHINIMSQFESSQNVYKATKQTVKILADCLRDELRSKKAKINVTVLNSELTENYESRKESQDEELWKTTCNNIVNAVKYILSIPSGVQMPELTLSAF